MHGSVACGGVHTCQKRVRARNVECGGVHACQGRGAQGQMCVVSTAVTVECVTTAKRQGQASAAPPARLGRSRLPALAERHRLPRSLTVEIRRCRWRWCRRHFSPPMCSQTQPIGRSQPCLHQTAHKTALSTRAQTPQLGESRISDLGGLAVGKCLLRNNTYVGTYVTTVQSLPTCSLRDTSSPVLMALMPSTAPVVANAQHDPHCTGAGEAGRPGWGEEAGCVGSRAGCFDGDRLPVCGRLHA